MLNEVEDPALTLVALILPLRKVPGLVKADSASESSETSSEHHWKSRRARKSQVITMMLSVDRLRKVDQNSTDQKTRYKD